MPEFFIQISPTPIFLFPFIDKNIVSYQKQKDKPKNFGLRTKLEDKKNGFYAGIISLR